MIEEDLDNLYKKRVYCLKLIFLNRFDIILNFDFKFYCSLYYNIYWSWWSISEENCDERILYIVYYDFNFKCKILVLGYC